MSRSSEFQTMMRAVLRFACWMVALVAGRADAQTSFPMLGSAFPTGVQRGKTTEVTVVAGGNGGASLHGAYRALVEGEGVKAEIVPPEKGWPKPDPKTPMVLPVVPQITLRVTVAPDASLGVREFRIATPRFGISTVGQLVIGDETEVVETEPNNEIEKAQVVPVPCVVNGRIQQSEDIDCFKFRAQAGQEIVFTVLCARLEDKIHDLQEHADPLLTLRDLTGRELAVSDDYYRADGLLHYRFDRAGDYVIQVRDVNYKGNPHWVYRLTITDRPYVVACVPCAVRPGQSNVLQVTGYNLGGVRTVTLDVPASLSPGIQTRQLKFPNGTSNPIPLLVTDLTQQSFEPRTATRLSGAVTATLAPGAPHRVGAIVRPGSVNSWLRTPGQIDRYNFTAKKGDGWSFEVTARRLDSEMDSELKLRDARGALLAENDDTFGKDSRIDWTAPADGEYTIEVRDLAGHAGPSYFYNITARPLLPDFRLLGDPGRAQIAPGNRTTWYFSLERKYGFAGEVKLEARGLPTGVTAATMTIPANMTQGSLILTAAPDAKLDASLVTVVGTATLPGADGKTMLAERAAVPLTEIYMPGGGRGRYEVQTQGVSLTEPNDLEVSVNTQTINLTPGGTAKVEVTLKRRPDYTKPVTLDVRVQHLGSIYANPLPPGVTVDEGQSKITLGENETKGHLTFRAAPDAQAVKDLPIAIIANASINFVMRVWFASPALSVTVTVPPKK